MAQGASHGFTSRRNSVEEQPTQSKNRRGPSVIVGIAVGVVAVLCLCLVIFGALAPSNRTQTADAPRSVPSVEQDQEVAAGASEATTDALKPIDTPEPTTAPVSTITPASMDTPVPTPIPTDTPVPTDTLIPTDTSVPTETPTPAIPTETPTPKPTKTPRPTATPKSPALIPGLWPADVTENMKTRGFECSGVQEGQDYLVWSCTRNSEDAMLRVDIYGRTLTSIDMIEAASLQFGVPDDELSTEFLGFVSTMPYDGASPDAARAWVRETLPTLQGAGDVRSATFGGVEYRLLGIPTARTLEIGTLQE